MLAQLETRLRRGEGRAYEPNMDGPALRDLYVPESPVLGKRVAGMFTRPGGLLKVIGRRC
jgi:hypothetical protein